MRNQADEIQDFKYFIRAIGRGQRAGRSLTQLEAYLAFSMLLSGQVTAEQRGAFLMLLRVREETHEEIAGFLQAAREFNHTGLANLHVDLDMGCYAGKRRQLPWFVLSAIVLAQSGRRVFLHGTHEPDSNRLYLDQVFPQLGLPICHMAEQVESELNSHGLAYMPLARVNKALDDVIQLRSQLGLRTCANTLARMLNPSQASHSLQGVFHHHIDKKHQQVAGLLEEPSMACFRGEGGEIEFHPHRPLQIKLCRGGKPDTIEVPAHDESWTSKPRQLDSRNLIGFWTGHKPDPYGEAATLGTLAIMLVLLDELSWPDAYRHAEQLWQTRQRHWPYPIPSPVPSLSA